MKTDANMDKHTKSNTMEHAKEKIRKYNREYQKKMYEKDPQRIKKYRNNQNIKKRYNIPADLAEDFKEDLYLVVKMKELIDDMKPGNFEKFLMIKNNLKLVKKD